MRLTDEHYHTHYNELMYSAGNCIQYFIINYNGNK